jgi:hypothetical protein
MLILSLGESIGTGKKPKRHYVIQKIDNSSEHTKAVMPIKSNFLISDIKN